MSVSTHPLDIAHATRTDPLRVLEEIQRLAVEQLGGLPSALFSQLTEDATNLTAEPAERLQFVDQAALRVLRQRHATHVMNFRQEIARGFDEFRARRLRNVPNLPLVLVDEHQLEFHLAGQRLAEAIQQRYPRPLEMMEGRLRALAIELRLPPAANPIGAMRLTSAFLQTFSEEQISHAMRVLMFRQYEQELARVLGDLYAKVNTLLSSSGYAVIDAERPPSGSFVNSRDNTSGVPGNRYEREDRRDHGSHAPAAGSAARTADAPTPNELSQLRSMLHAWREGVLNGDTVDPAHAPRRPMPPRREMRVEEVISVASLLQSEPTDPFARALAGSGRLADVIRDQLNDGSRRLGLNPDQIRFSVDEEDAIDLIALLFDSLFQSHRLQERARRLYARLVLPFVKVALTDQSLFVQTAHPARRLLDAITEACAGNNAETPQERELLARAAAASQRIVAEYNEDLAIFEVAHAELDALLQQQRRRIEMQEERAAKATSGRERLSHAREQADAILAQLLATSPLSRAVADFLVTPWRHHLVQTLLREGEGAERHAEALALGDALVAADRLAADGDGHALAQHMLALEPAIVACLASSGLDSSAAEHGLAVLVKGLAYPHTPRELHPLPPSQANHEDLEERGLWLAGGTDTVPHDPALAERMRQLQPGDWLQLVDVNGENASAKVAWVSPLTARRLLVNRRGVRVLVASAEELAALAGDGRLVLGGEPTAFDEAMRHVRQQLDRAVGQR